MDHVIFTEILKKRRMKRTFYLLVFQILSIIPAIGQANVDSLVNILETREISIGEKLELYKQIGVAYSYFDYNRSMKYAEEGMTLAKKEKDKIKMSNFNHIMGLNHYTRTDYDSAIIYYNRALELAIEMEDVKHEGGLYTSIGSSYNQLSEFNTAMDYYLKALAINEALDNKTMCMTIMGNLSTLHRRMKNNDRAIYYLEQIMEMADELNYLPGKCRAYFDLGGIYKENKEYEKALEYELKVVEISRSINLKQYEIASIATVAEIYSEGFGEYIKAEEYANEAMIIANEFGDLSLQRAIWVILSDIYRKQGKFKESGELGLKALSIPSKELGMNQKLLSNLIWANILSGNKNDAISYLEDYENVTSEFNKKSLHESLSEMEVKYETEKKTLRIDALEKEKQLYLWLGLSGIILLSMLIGLLFYRHRLNLQNQRIAEQKIKQLEQEKLLIATQAVLEGETAERLRLARDLHDGLGGMLSVIKLNLKDIYNTHLEGEIYVNRFGKAIGMLDESIKELRRVAHHMMPESLIHFGLKVSLEDFCRAISIAHFQYLGKESRLDNRLEEMIYRCAYELVNNAIKHADATTINVQLLVDNKLIALTVYDDGKGFSPEDSKAGTGLRNIQARVSVYNGKMSIRSTPGKGTETIVEIELL